MERTKFYVRFSPYGGTLPADYFGGKYFEDVLDSFEYVVQVLHDSFDKGHRVFFELLAVKEDLIVISVVGSNFGLFE